MKRSHIRNAYDQMTPTREQKDRMLTAILEIENGKKRGKYQAQPTKTHAWSFIPAVAALALVIAAGVIVLGRTPQTEHPVQVDPTIEIPSTETAEIPVVYSEIIRTCRTALEEGWDAEKCQSFSISPRFANTEYASVDAGFQLLDIDCNGTQELILGYGDSIWNLYTLEEDNTAVQLVNDTNDGAVYQLHEGAHIVKERTTKEEGWHDCYLLKGTELVLETSIYGLDTTYTDQLTGQSLAPSEALTLIHKYSPMELQLTCFYDMPEALYEGSEILELYTPFLEKYKTALQQNWSWEQCDMADISRQIMFGSANRQNLGWCLLDLDNNGVEELIISDGVQLFDLYTIMPTDGLPVHILSGNPYSYSLCKDRTIERRITNGDFSYWSWFRFSEIDYVEEQKLILDNTIHQYYLGVDETNSRTITESEAGEYLTGDEKATMELTLTPFLENWTVSAQEPNYYYEPIIETYRKAIAESWDPGKCVENGISLMIGYYGQLYDELGHNQIDLNGDGNAELIITDGTNIFDLYTVIHDEEDGPLRLIDATERNAFYLADGNNIYNRASNGAANTLYNFYSVGERGLVLSQTVVFDATDDPGNPWFLHYGDEKLVSIKENEAREIIDSMAILEISFIPFGDGGLTATSEESEWEKAKQTAFDILKSGGEFGYAEYIAWLIPWREQEFENPRPLYYYLHDANGDKIADLILGYEDEVTAVWTYVYNDKAKEEQLTLLDLSEQQWSELDQSWPDREIRQIENFLRNE